MAVAEYKDDKDIMRELLCWMKMLASVKSGANVTERFVMLNTLARNLGDVALQEVLLKTVKDQVCNLAECMEEQGTDITCIYLSTLYINFSILDVLACLCG